MVACLVCVCSIVFVRRSEIAYVCKLMPLYMWVMGWHIGGTLVASVTELKQKAQLASLVLEAHMVMFNYSALYQRV